VFVVPHGEFTYVGTTDTDYDGPVDDPQCTPEDIEYLLRALNGSCTNEITAADIVGSWAGLRPLVKAAASGRTADLSRKHKVARSRSVLVTITGGKLTTYREMAADTVDEVVDVLGARLDHRSVGRSRTKRLRLRGADGYDEFVASPPASSLSPAQLTHLAYRYGGDARTLVAMVEHEPGLAQPLVPGLPYLRAEARYAARYEMARSLDDLLSRRTRARLLARDASAEAADDIAALVADDLGWDEATRHQQVADYRASIDHEREAAQLPESPLDALLGA
jgi:glycerol-3-phosphate dehydrogenase